MVLFVCAWLFFKKALLELKAPGCQSTLNLALEFKLSDFLRLKHGSLGKDTFLCFQTFLLNTYMKISSCSTSSISDFKKVYRHIFSVAPLKAPFEAYKIISL